MNELLSNYMKHLMSVRSLIDWINQNDDKEELKERNKQLERDAADYKARPLLEPLIVQLCQLFVVHPNITSKCTMKLNETS